MLDQRPRNVTTVLYSLILLIRYSYMSIVRVGSKSFDGSWSKVRVDINNYLFIIKE